MAFRTYRHLTRQEVAEAALLLTDRTGLKRFGGRYDAFLDYVHSYMAAGAPEDWGRVVCECDADFGGQTAGMLQKAAIRIEDASRMRQFGSQGTDSHAYLHDASHRRGYQNR